MTEPVMGQSPPEAGWGLYWRQVWANRSLILIWAGSAISVFGDAFFNVAVTWIVYAQSGSVLQTALVQIVWHLADVAFGPVAGVLADRWDRKAIMVTTSLLAAGVAGAVAALLFATGTVPLAGALGAIFALNALTTFFRPARSAVLPAIVERGLLATIYGWFTTIFEIAILVGSAVAGVVVSLAGASWAVVVDACSFVATAVLIGRARLPRRAAVADGERRPSWGQDLAAGWRVISDHALLRALVWLEVLLNVAAFTGPLYPALIAVQLDGGVAAYGGLQAVGVLGSLAGGAMAGFMERRFGAGRLLAGSTAFAGLVTFGIAFSSSLPLTLSLVGLMTFGLAVGGIAANALAITLVPDEFRGRLVGISVALAVAFIPLSTAVGAWLADRVGVAPLFVVAGVWTLAVAWLTWSNPYVRAARIV